MAPTRPRPALVGGIVVLAGALAVAGSACGPLRGRTAGGPTPTGAGGGVARTALPACGDPSDALVPRAGPLAVAAELPTTAPAGDATFAATVTVTATARVAGVAAPVAGLYVTRDGRVLATPVAADLVGVAVSLAPGATQVFPATGSLRACSGPPGPGPGDGTGPALPAGRYEVFAVVTVTDDTGASVTATGGPWPLEIT